MNKNNESKVSLETWQRLYAAAIKVREMAPWQWMEETDVFGVWPHGRDMAAFVSVMGSLGEYPGVAVYPGPKELQQFWQIESMPEDELSVEHVMNMAQLHAAFGSARDVEAEDKRIVKELGLKFRGNYSRPYFRSFRPGFFPWFLDPEEANLLTCALEQLLEIAPRVQKDRNLLIPKDNGTSVLVRRPANDHEEGSWREEFHIFPPVATTFRIEVPASLMSAVRAMKPSGLTFEVDVFSMSFHIGKKGERPQRSYALLVVDSESFFVFGVDLLSVETTTEAMWATVPARLWEMFYKNNIRPSVIVVRTPWVEMVLDRACAEVGIKLQTKRQLPALDSAREDLERFHHSR